MKIKIILTLVLSFLLFNCRKSDDISIQESYLVHDQLDPLVSAIKAFHENKTLTTLVNNNFNPEAKNQAVRSNLIPDYRNSSTRTLPNGATFTTIETDNFTIENEKIGFLRVFVFLGAKGEIVDGKIVEIYGDKAFLKKNRKFLINNYNDRSIVGFTGSIFTYDVYYRPLRTRTYKDGEVLKINSGIIRKSSTQESKQVLMRAPDCNQTARQECYDVYWVTDTSSEYLYSYCCSGGDGGPGGGGAPTTPVPIDSFSGFPVNPIDGQVAVFNDPNSSNNSVEFTYSSSMGLWLMPEVQALRDIGNTLSIPNAPIFDPGNILTSIALVAVVDPTFVGKLVLSGAALFTGAIYVYHYAQWMKLRENPEHESMCQMYLVPCIGRGLDCISCYQYCLRTGLWEGSKCPGITPETSRVN